MRSRRKKKETKSKAALIVGLAFILAVLWVWKSIEAHNMARELSNLDNEKKRIVEDNKNLKAELEKLRSIAWVDSCVRTNYGMTYGVKERMVLFDSAVEKKAVSRNMFASTADYLIEWAKIIFERL